LTSDHRGSSENERRPRGGSFEDATSNAFRSFDEETISRVKALLAVGRRQILGIAGLPGAGKSSFARTLQAALGDIAAVVPMDGFHLSNFELARLGRTNSKGAPDTFDGAGYLALVRRIKEPSAGEVVYAPEFDRSLDAAISGAIPVGPEVRLIITEGNYLLLDEAPWTSLVGVLDAIWFVDVPEDRRHAQLLRRHMRFGRSREDALAWITSTDDPNARRIAAGVEKADYRVKWAITTELEDMP
jgi:pantothenate kinase